MTPAEIKRALKLIVGEPLRPVFGEVTEITGATCTVKLQDGLEIPGVRLKPSDLTEKYMQVTPVVGSTVVCLSVTNDLNDLFVALTDHVQLVEIKDGDFNALIDLNDGKISVKNGSTSLLKLFDDLTDLITNLKVLTSAGPSTGLAPDSVAALNAFTTKYKSILK